MLDLPVLRWGKPYESLQKQEVKHFLTGETVATVSQAIPGLLNKDARHMKRAREVLREIPCADLVEMMRKAGDLFLNGTLPLGNGEQTPEDYAVQQSATTGLPVHLCRGNMSKNHFVLHNMAEILDALTRGLDLDILTRGYGVEERGVTISYQAQSPVVGMVLPSNSPGVHTLWLPIIPLQVGLVLKPGPQEPWTPYRMASAFMEAGIPPQALGIYPGEAEMGAAVVDRCDRTMIFGGKPTVERYRGDPRVQVHGPGFSKILLGDDVVDDWEQHLDLMVDSVYKNSGRGCINCSGIWASRHTEEIAQALAERLGPIQALPPEDPEAGLAAFTVPGQAAAVARSLEQLTSGPGTKDMTAPFGSRLVEEGPASYLRPMVVHCDSPERPLAHTEYMFPFVTVVRCPQETMAEAIGETLVGTAITEDRAFQEELMAATHIDRLNIGPIPTIQLNWLQPHEGNLIDFLFRARAFQAAGA